MRSLRRPHWLLVSLLSLLFTSAQAQVVISQVYGGGGNSGAPLRSDFIELFNAGSTAVDLGGWSVQYASSTGTTWQRTDLGSVSLQPGQYLLVKEADGSNTSAPALPTPDVLGTIAMSGSNGKVALVDNSTTLSGACPSAVVDLVGYGSANCPAAPASKTPSLSNSTAAIRNDGGCAITGDLASDFSTGTPAPRNSASPTAPCADAGGPPSLSIADVSVLEGDAGSTLVDLTISLNKPALAGGVGFDLASADGSATLADNDYIALGQTGLSIAEGETSLVVQLSINADTQVEDDETLSISVGNVVGATVADADAVVTIRNDDFVIVGIHAVQGDGRTSPLPPGSLVAIEGIVTARLSNGFFVQSGPGEEDADPATSEGLFVFTSSAPSSAATIGNRVRVVGTLSEFAASGQLPMTELTNATVIALGTGNPLPAPIELTAENAYVPGSLDALERFEGMRVSVARLQVVAPSGGNISETRATSTNNGIFYGVPAGVPRPFREPGLEALDPLVPPAGVTPPRFDMNYERIRVRSTGQTGAPQVNADAGDAVTGLIGVLDFSFGAYTLSPDPDAGIQVLDTAGPRAVSAATENEFTIAGFNLLRFFDDQNDPSVGEPVLTADAYANRLMKTSNAICAFTRNPDVLGVVEIENLASLQALADAINSQAGNTLFPGSCSENPQYQAFLVEGNDVGGIDVGFLVKTAEVAPGTPRVEVLSVTQVGKDTLLENPDNSTSLLNDRPPLVLEARIHFADGRSREVTVIANHLRSLSGVNSTDPGSSGWPTDGDRVRAKRAAQAVFTANLVEGLQQADADKPIVLLGDFNAFEFNDGLVDTMGIITGREAPADQVVRFESSPISVPLTNMAERMPADDRYSFSFDGNAQSLDHMVVNQALLDFAPAARAEHAHINADFGTGRFGDFGVPERVSDHDPVVLFVPVPALDANPGPNPPGPSFPPGRPPSVPPGPNNHQPTGSVQIVGELREGMTADAVDDIADVDGLGPFTYTWFVGGKRLPTASGRRLLIDDTMNGRMLRVDVGFIDGKGFHERVRSLPVGPVQPAGTSLSFQQRVFFANPARNREQQTFIRMVNANADDAVVELLGFDDNGDAAPGGAIALLLAAGQALQLNADDLENGNLDKGLLGAFGVGVGKWQIKINSSVPLRVQSLIRTPDGLLTSVSEIAAPGLDGSITLPFANPADNVEQQSFIRVVNRTDVAGNVRISAVDDAGKPAPGGALSFALAANAALNFNARDYELGNPDKGLLGGFGSGTGKWRLRIEADVGIAAMGLVRTADGFVTNLSATAPAAADAQDADRMLLTLSPADADASEGFVRLVNPGARRQRVLLAAIDAHGRRPRAPVSVDLAAGAAVQLRAEDLEHGQRGRGVESPVGGWGDGTGRWQVVVVPDPTADAGVLVQSLQRNGANFITNLSGRAPSDSPFMADLWTFNPASNANQRSVLRLINQSTSGGQVMIEAIDDAGQLAPGGSLIVDLDANAAVELSAADLEQGNPGKGVFGALGDGAGKWRLHLSADVAIAAQSLLQAAGGFETDLSAVID